LRNLIFSNLFLWQAALAEDAGSFWRKQFWDLASVVVQAIASAMAVAIALLLFGAWRFSGRLKSSPEWLKATGLDLWFAERIGQFYLSKARRVQRKSGPEKGLAYFNRGLRRLNSVLEEGRERGGDMSRTGNLLIGSDLAAFYSLLAWEHNWYDENLAEGIRFAELACTLDPQLVDARIARGWGKLRRNKGADLAEATGDFLDAIEIGEQRGIRYFFALFGHAEALRLRGEYEKVIEEYTPLLSGDIELANVYVGRGFAYHSLAKWQQALDDVTAALALDPDLVLARSLRADDLRLLGRLEEAAEECRQLIRRVPGDSDSYYILGLILYQQSQGAPQPDAKRRRELLEEAGKQLRIAESLAGENGSRTDIYYRLAAVASDLRNEEDSQHWLSLARGSAASTTTQMDPPVRDVLALWPSVRDLVEKRVEGDLETTLREALVLIRSRPDDASAHYAGGLLYLALAEGLDDPARRSQTIGQAILLFDKATQLNQTWAEPCYLRALAYLWRGDLTLARDDCDRTIRLNPDHVRGHYLRAKVRLAIDSHDQALDDIAAAMRLLSVNVPEEKDGAWYSLRSELQLLQGNLDSAVEDATTAIGLAPSNVTALLILSQALQKGSKFEQALFQAERAARISPANWQAHTARGLALFSMRRRQEAIAAFTRVIELRPSESSAYLNRGWARLLLWDQTRAQGDLALADDDFARAVEQPAVAAQAHAARAWVRYWQHQGGAATLDAALTLSSLAIERDPKLGFAYFVRGWVMLAKGKNADSRAQFIRASELGYEAPDASYGLAETERVLGNADAAIEIYTKAIGLAAKSSTNAWHMHYGLALVHAANRNWEVAYNGYCTALESAREATLSPSQYAYLYANLGWTCYELGDKDREMEDAFTQGVALEGQVGYLQSKIAMVRLYCGRYDEASAAFTATIKLDPESSVGYVNRGLTAIYRGDLDAALLDLNMAVEKNAQDAFAWHTRGWARLRLAENDREQVLADIDRAIEIAPDEPFRFSDRALVRWWLKDRQGALDDLRKVLDLKLPERAVGFPRRDREDAVTWGATSQDWTHAIQKKPKDFLPYLGRGISFCLAGNLREAQSDLTMANAINRRSREARLLLESVDGELASRGVAPH